MKYVEEDRGYETPCWIWQGYVGNHGYGVRSHHGVYELVHRASYEAHIGPIPAGLTIDHLCRVPLCVNPSHLEAVTTGENVLRGESPPARNARKTHCAKGHPYSDENTYRKPNGWRECRICMRERDQKRPNGWQRTREREAA